MVTIPRAACLPIAAAMLVASSPSIARPADTARLVSCDTGDCVIVRGHRTSPQAIVRINDRPVAARGGTAWQVRLPVATVRDWSAPFARTLRIAVTDGTGAIERDAEVRLPVGLLAGKIELASLVVRAR